MYLGIVWLHTMERVFKNNTNDRTQLGQKNKTKEYNAERTQPTGELKSKNIRRLILYIQERKRKKGANNIVIRYRR
jgi:hypothetical protein